MASANSNIQVADLDFVNIKNNFITYLKGQDTFKDYNFTGSALSTLLDVLTYNTQYNAYYLNMVANEMFLDTALQRSSVVSHAKLMDYQPASTISSTAVISLTANGVSAATVTLPKYTNFISGPVNGTSYNFVTTDTYTVNTNLVTNSAQFNNITIRQGTGVVLTLPYVASANPEGTFLIADSFMDTTTLLVQVFDTNSSTTFTTYTPASDYLTLTGTTPVYFIQEETMSGYYQISFGDGILGRALTDGNQVVISYISSDGAAPAGANSFAVTSTLGSNYNLRVTPVQAATGGMDKESIKSIKYNAPKNYATQNRAVTKDDYITLIQQNNLGYAFDAVNVWGGQENNPPVYGQVFISMKPTGSYVLTQTQKQKILNNVIKPISMMTVTPTIIDPDYTYIKINCNVIFDPKKTNYTASQVQTLVTAGIKNFAASTLNTFNSSYSNAELITDIQSVDPSIVSNESTIQLQKKFYPNITQSETYTFDFGTPLQQGILTSGISSYPAMQFRDPTTPTNTIDGIYIEEVPSTTVGVASISLINPGYSYQFTPTVSILGDGSGATASAVINSAGQIERIDVLTAGQNYTQAIVVITPTSNDSTGTGGAATVTLEGQYGTLRSYYYNSKNVKTIFSSNVGTVDYINGIVTLNSFNPYDIDNPLGQLTITVNPTTTLLSSSYNKILTVDPLDATAINVTVAVKS